MVVGTPRFIILSTLLQLQIKEGKPVPKSFAIQTKFSLLLPLSKTHSLIFLSHNG